MPYYAAAWGLAVGLSLFVLNIYHSSGPAVTPSQPDTLLYHQYARGLAEGHPYRFTAGQEPSTASTSHLYPAVLALLYLAGAQGEWLGVASFTLGILCYTAVLVLACLIVRAIRPSATLPALILCGSSGHLAFALLGDSDITLFAPLALGALAAALYRRHRTLAVLLFLSSLCRPEGMLLSGLLLVVLGVSATCNKPSRTWARPLLIAGGVGLAGCAVVFLLNLAMTGELGFQSVRHKGYFNNLPLPRALIATARDFMAVFVEVLWGTGGGSRTFYSAPLLGGGLFFLGVLGREWAWSRRAAIETWILLSILAATGLVATSGWAGVILDRYFGWWIPLMYIYTGIGACVLCDLAWSSASARERRHRVLAITLVCAFFQTVGAVYFTAEFIAYNVRGATVVQFYRDVHARLPADKRIGILDGSSGAAYYMPGREVYQLDGFTSPNFNSRAHRHENVETLKHRPDLRFDYWLTTHASTNASAFAPLVGPAVTEESSIVSGSGELALFHADWTVLPSAWEPRKPSVVEALDGWALVDALDVGYGRHEASHDWRVKNRYDYLRLYPFVVKASAGGQDVLEVGRVVLGTESFELATHPGKPLQLVMRTILEVRAGMAGADRAEDMRPFTMTTPLAIDLRVDGQPTRTLSLAVTEDSSQFDEVIISLPGKAIVNDRTRITLEGDYISCGYWAYQEASVGAELHDDIGLAGH